MRKLERLSLHDLTVTQLCSDYKSTYTKFESTQNSHGTEIINSLWIVKVRIAQEWWELLDSNGPLGRRDR